MQPSCGPLQNVILNPLSLALAAIVWLGSSGFSLAQRTIHVPADQPTIQAGIDAAQNGDTVLVAPGTYQEAIDFRGKAITVTSGATSYTGAAGTVIQAPESVSAVTMHSGEPVTAVLNGFTVTHGVDVDGVQDVENGVDLAGSSGTITNNIIQNNAGCAVSAYQSPNLVVQGNHILGQYQPTNLINQKFDCGYRNESPDQSYGTGFPAVFIYWCTQISITGNLIENNSSIGTNGIVDEYTEESLIQGNTIHNNITGEAEIAGIDIRGPKSATVVQNLVYENNETNPTPPTEPYISIIDQRSSLDVYPFNVNAPVVYGLITLVALNNTFYADGHSGSIEDDGSDTPYYFPTELYLEGNMNPLLGPTNTFASATLENNLFITNQSYAPAVSCEYVGTGNVINFHQNDVVESSEWYDTCAQSGDTSNLSVDPQFISPSTNNLHVEPSAPIIAAGDINASPLPPADLDGKNRFVCGTIDMGAYEKHPRPPIRLTASANPIAGGSSVTFTAQFTGNCNVPSGSIRFMDGTNLLGAATLNSSGMTSFSTTSLTVGTHTITALYPGDFNFDKSTSSPLTEVVTGAPTSTKLTVSPNPASAFTPITLSSIVTSTLGQPTGTVVFTSGGQVLATATVGANGVATTTISTLGARSYSIVATYQATTTYEASSSAPVSETVIGAESVAALSAAPNPATAGQTVTFTATVRASQGSAVPTGTVTFSEGRAVLGSSTLNATGAAMFTTASLTTGTHTITASYGGSTNFNPSSATITETITFITTTTNLTASPNPAGQGQTVTLTATVGVSGATPSGNVTFEDGEAAIGTAALNGTGTAMFTTSTLAIGTHSLTAVYAGGGSLSASISPVVQETIVAEGFTLSVSPATLTLRVGQSGTVNVSLGSYGGYSGAVSLSMGSQPAYVTGTFNPAQVAALSSGNATSKLTISTSFIPTAKVAIPSPMEDGTMLGGALATLLFFPFAWKKRSRRLRMFALNAIALTLIALNGCGGNVAIPIHTVDPGTYTVHVTATDASNDQKSATVTLIVTQ